MLSSGLTTHIRGKELSSIQVAVNGSVDLGSGVLLAQELEHESNTAESSNWVRDTLAFNVRGTAVAGLTDSEVVTNVGAGDETQATNEGSGTVRENVTVQVRGDNDIVVLGLAEELVDHGVNDLLFDVNGGELLSGKGLARSLTEETVGLGEHVGLVGDSDHGLAAGGGAGGSGADVLAAESNLTGDGGDAHGGALGDALDSLGNLAVGALSGALLLHVQVLGVLADDDEVNGVAVAAADGGLDGANIGVEVELLAESDNGGGVAGDLGARGAGDGQPLSAGLSRKGSKGKVCYLTAPKRAPSHSFFKVSTVLSGRAVPVFWKVS